MTPPGSDRRPLFNARRYIVASLRQYGRIHLSVAAGVAVATAVITGALLVGDSMRGSLRDLALESLGRVDVLLTAERPFSAALARTWTESLSTEGERPVAAPLMLTSGSAVFRSPTGVRRAAQLQVVGTSAAFWGFGGSPGAGDLVLEEGVALARPVADELGVGVGDAILLRLPAYSSLPADSVLGEKEEISASRRLRVTRILGEGADGFPARFAVRPSQQAPRNVFVPLAVLQDLLELPDQANAIAVADLGANGGEAARRLAQLGERLRPELSDYGLTVRRIALGDGAEREYIAIASDRQVLSAAAADAITESVGGGGQRVVTYLANKIAAGESQIPYSIVSGVDSTAELGPLLDAAGQPMLLADDEIVLNDWAAEQLGVAAGDSVTLTWYEPETTHGQLREEPPLALRVRAIVPLADADGQPTWAADPDFAPELPGVTDQQSINDWELPFELVEPIRDEDEQYWDEHRTTPKAFVSHALAARLWGTRWGTESVVRLPTAGRTADGVAAKLRADLDPTAMGMSLVPVKRQALAAASGTTPFDGLFLGFSFFLMASAVLLTLLLFRLGVEQRLREVGVLLAVGLGVRRVSRLLTAEGAVVAAAGATIGVPLGVLYARLLVYGLNTWWVDATVTPFLRLHVTPRSLLLGFAAGVVVALETIVLSLRRFARLPVRQLLAGNAESFADLAAARRRTRAYLPAACFVAATGLGLVALRWEGEAQAGAFFGGGALVLTGALLAVRGKLREVAPAGPPRSFSLAGLALRNVRRNPSRTMLSLALSATASFLIVALSAFRLAPSDRGVGGFDLLATADLPVLYDFGSAAGRQALGFSEEDSARLADATGVGFRVRDGQDASCLNLYQPTQPRILGAPSRLAEASRFAWAAGVEGWNALEQPADGHADDAVVPAVLDRNTAAYSLKVGVGDRLPVETAAPPGAELQVAGLLANSVLQGDVLISDGHFRRLFPEVAGQRFFLIRRGARSPAVDELAALLESQLEDYGFDAVDARRRLAELLAVQNTYLSTFQSLGALGLLLGVVGLAVVQLRSVLERRGELALLQAAGFRRRRLALMVLGENLALLAGGLAIGGVAALAAVVPHAVVERVGTPWGTLAALLLIVLAVGGAAGWLASRLVLRAPLAAALRGE